MTGTLSPTALYAAIDAVDMAAVPVMTTDRCISRKTQAALARQLFRSLGLKGISVTAPHYAMAHLVEVRLPEERPTPADFLLDGIDYRHNNYSDMPRQVPARAMRLAKLAAEKRLDAILLVAFPNHDDRSDVHSDYFDHCWSIG